MRTERDERIERNDYRSRLSSGVLILSNGSITFSKSDWCAPRRWSNWLTDIHRFSPARRTASIIESRVRCQTNTAYHALREVKMIEAPAPILPRHPPHRIVVRIVFADDCRPKRIADMVCHRACISPRIDPSSSLPSTGYTAHTR